MLILIDGAVEHKGSGECFRKSREAFLRCITSAILPDSSMVDRFAGFLPEIRGDFTYAPCRFFFAEDSQDFFYAIFFLHRFLSGQQT